MDQIILKGMPFFAYHGVLPEENVTGQRFIVNVTLDCDLRQASHSDSVEDTINYAEVYAVVKEVVERRVRKLIEAVAEDIASELFALFPKIVSLSVEVEKPGAPIPGIFEQVSVKISRSRS